MEIVLGADHRGFNLKKEIKEWLAKKGYTVKDKGAASYEAADDYPDFALAVAQEVAVAPKDRRGVLICGSGIGMAVAANKVRGVRAGQPSDAQMAKKGRQDDDINIVSLGADFLTGDQAKAIVATFIEMPFTDEARHVRRLNKITKLEES